MTNEDSKQKKENELSLESMRNSVQEVLSYVSLILSKSAMNPFILTRIESEIGLNLPAVRSILQRVDEIIKITMDERTRYKKVSIKEVLSWIPLLKRFHVVLENLPMVLGPYRDLEIFNRSIYAKENLLNIIEFLEDFVKKATR